MKTNGNDSVAAYSALHADGSVYEQHIGLTKREYFAAMAMQEMLANDNGFTTDTGFTSTGIDQKARFCTLMADALIEALNK